MRWPPGLYEIVITPKPGTAAPSEDEAADFDLAIEERSLDDICALGWQFARGVGRSPS